jgi:FMN-dependent NADH-azoreductase
MTSVLAIFSSLNGEQGNSSKLARAYLAAKQKSTDIRLKEVDLSVIDLPHLSDEEMDAWVTAPKARSEAQRALAALSDEAVAAVSSADEIVIAVPMYNFGIPSSLKAYFDRLARAGVTFKYTENGPVGLLEGKRATILAARGGVYQGTEFDTQSAYLKHFLNFIGIVDVEFVYAEGLAMGEEQASESFSVANKKIMELTR